MQATAKLPESIREHISNMHITDKPSSQSSSFSRYEKYLPSEKELTKIEELVKIRTGLKLQRGDSKIFLITREGARELSAEYYSSLLTELKLDKKTFDFILKQVLAVESRNSKTAPGYYHPPNGRIYCIPENLEKEIRDWSVGLVKLGIIQGKLHGIFRKEADAGALSRATKFIGFNVVAHESTHKALHQNNLAIDREDLKLRLQMYELGSKIHGADEKEGKKLLKSLEQFRKKIDTIKTFDEAVAYSVACRVMQDLGFDKEALHYMKCIKISDPNIAVGIAFFEEIESIARRNPIPLIYKNLPESMHEIENPRAYLRRTTGWRV